MTTALNDLLKRLQAAYPTHGFELLSKAECGADAAKPEQIIAFEHSGVCITDPYSSECSRFEVDPTGTYGITAEDARCISAWNYSGIVLLVWGQA
jgi:hypothetical protein